MNNYLNNSKENFRSLKIIKNTKASERNDNCVAGTFILVHKLKLRLMYFVTKKFMDAKEIYLRRSFAN